MFSNKLTGCIMVLDGHIHINEGPVSQKELLLKLNMAEIDGGLLLSLPPTSFRPKTSAKVSNQHRLENLMSCCENTDKLFPFYWIDPMESDAILQVSEAIRSGVAGFKVICNTFYPFEETPMKIFNVIAELGKPVLFHSGILWDGKPSSIYNRPVNFECLLEIPNLRFALAHISWPWCDELIAVYGKFIHAKSFNPEITAQMFIDMTPGTPEIYRADAIEKLLKTDYPELENKLFFGTDNSANAYDIDWARRWMKIDRKIFSKLGWGVKKLNKINSRNLLDFIGINK